MSDVDHFRSLVHYRVKNGSRILFWHDVWSGDQPLKCQSPDLSRMIPLKEATVHEVVCWNGNQCHLSITFLRSLNDGEEEGVMRLCGFTR